MGNIMDYISWRGDLSFEQSQFNEVDNLILACFSYVNLDGISAVTKQKGIGLKKLTKEFMKLHTMKELEADKSYPPGSVYDDGNGEVCQIWKVCGKKLCE